MRLPVGVVDSTIYDYAGREIITVGGNQNRLTPGLANANHGEPAAVDIRKCAQIGHGCIHVPKHLLICQLHTTITACQGLSVTHETGEEVWDNRHIAGIDQLLL
jgi:hypothetical protein